MKELVVISGKGGTGKTSLMAGMALLADNKVLCDADVDAADLHLLMSPEVQEQHDFSGGNTAVIDPAKCTECGICRDLCKWNAINTTYMVDQIDCEGCGVCVYLCPEKAIGFPENICGEWFISKTRFGPMVHARLGIAEENSGKLVSLVRAKAQKLADAGKLGLIITDGPPGIGCPVIAAIGGATAVLIVAEPTLSGLHDMKRAADLAFHFRIPSMLCVNKFDLNTDQARSIEDSARKKGIRVLSGIPFDPLFTEAMIQGKTVLEFNAKSNAGFAVKKVWNEVAEHLELNRS